MLTLALIIALFLAIAAALWATADAKEARVERDAWRMAHETASARYEGLREAIERERSGRHLAVTVHRPTGVTPGWLAVTAHQQSMDQLVPYVEGPQ